jgi:hypothetical protein
MKKTLVILSLCIALSAQAQQNIKYKVVIDDPSKLPSVVVNLDLFGMEVWKPKTDFGLNFGFGIWGHVEVPKAPVTVQYQFYRSYFEDAGLLIDKEFPKATNVQLGALLTLADNTKRKTIGVGLDNKVVDREYSTNARGERIETRTSQLTSINVPANVRNQFGVRGGLIFRNAGIAFNEGLGEAPSQFSPKPYDFAGHFSTNIYAGLELRNTINLVLLTDKYGRTTTGSRMSSTFADVILPVVNRFNHPSGDDIQQLMRDSLSGFPLGFRIGLQNNPIEKREFTKKKFGLATRGEVGYKPFTGWYAVATIGINIIKYKK